jgi:4-amino-4-deoxy-L-arabinose transferase-like glycosyltransferase
MESQKPTTRESRLRPSDYLLLLLLCAILYGFSLVHWRVFTTHETVHCQNVREMFASGDWLIPTYGGRPWLERPPLPHWLTGFGALIGGMDHDWPFRVGSIVVATLAILIFASALARCLGRKIGVLSGAILATTREFAAYAVGPEADIFLASAITILGSLFLRLQFAPRTRPECETFFGRRSPAMFGFFFLLGLTNWMKGPLFGMLFILLPIGAYFLWNRRLSAIRPYLWFWGWLITLAVGVAWPLIAYDRYPDIIELWMVDYGVRWESGYLGEPLWYYLVEQQWNLFPWTVAVLAGVILTFRNVRSGEPAAWRFLWCWAAVPVLFFSLFKGKHHHYMLGCLAPAAALAAVGTISLWRIALAAPGWLRQLTVGFLLVGIPGSILIAIYRYKIPGPDWVGWFVTIGWPLFVALSWWIATRPQGRLAFAGLCALIVAIDCLAYAHRAHFLDSYQADSKLIADVYRTVDPATPVLVVADDHPLNSSWLLFYLGGRSRLLHNLTFLRDDRIKQAEVYLICRQRDQTALAEYGIAERLAQSGHARGESSPDDRWTLYKLRFHPHLARVPGDVRISPLQATGRRPGPFLGHSVAIGMDEHAASAAR